QSTLIGEVYKNGIINIAASASIDSEDGLFFGRNPILVQPLQVRSRFPPHDQAQPIQYYNIVDHNLSSVEEAPLNGRSWVMQERMIAAADHALCLKTVVLEIQGDVY